MKDYLTQTSLLRLLAVMLLVLLPHFSRIPLWETALVLLILIWRALTVLRQWPMPGRAPLVLLTLAAIAGVIASYGRLNGQMPGTALVVIMGAMKLLEMRSRRDVIVTVFLLYFLLITHFLFSQELWTIAYLLVCVTGITAFLIEVNHAGQALPLRFTLRYAGRMIGFSLPMMVVFFILFPRIPGPLWGLPSDSGAARSGLSDSMSPGDISKLIQSQEIAFRVRFEGTPPPKRELYWRGPVFDHFDGRAWSPAFRFFTREAPPSEYRSAVVNYEVTLEPTRTHWLMALDLPSPQTLPAGAYLNADHQLMSDTLLRERKLYRVGSHTQYVLQTELPSRSRARFLRLPDNGNISTRVLAQNWRAEGLDDAQIVQRALLYFREEPFFYTLNPPALGSDSVDEFLFQTRRGFCEHYASSFTFLMRAAGVPARVVTGYQGGEKNDVGDYYIVRQSDAHAWAEVWLAGKGWLRIDPTGAVAPNRVELGIEETLSQSGELPAYMLSGTLMESLQAHWDWVNNQWNYWVLAYGPELQQEFLKRFGITDWSQMILALTVLVTLIGTVIGILLMRQFAPARATDEALLQWRRALKRLRKRGLAQRPHEGPQDFIRRASEEEPELDASLQPLLEAYLRARYTHADADSLSALRTLARTFKKRLSF